MKQRFLGVDVAGAKNTWICELEETQGGQTDWLATVRRETLVGITASAKDRHFLGVAIDAQLTWASTEETGFRSSDLQLRDLVPDSNWVASQNSLMAVPVRGRQVAELVAPQVGTIIETHPRACLFLWRPDLLPQIRTYKGKKPQAGSLQQLWDEWLRAFSISWNGQTPDDDGQLDAVVCATVAALYHTNPSRLHVLEHTAVDVRGIGPFVVFGPNSLDSGSTVA